MSGAIMPELEDIEAQRLHLNVLAVTQQDDVNAAYDQNWNQSESRTSSHWARRIAGWMM
jgi:hypothetical protein